MTGLLTFVFVIIIIVGFHESAHFLFMKMWGVKVIRFSIGFGPILVTKKIGETDYQIAAIPLGGYVLPLSRRMEESSDYKMYLEPDHPEKYFESKPAWQRVVIYLAGPLSNLFFAFILYFFLFVAIGIPSPTTVIEGVAEKSPAESVGIRAGDKLEYVDDFKVIVWDDFVKLLKESDGRELKLGFLRGGEMLEFKVSPRKDISNGVTTYRIGVSCAMVYAKMGFSHALIEAYADTKGATLAYAGFFKELFTGKSNKESFGGPIMIYQITAESVKHGVAAVIGLMIMLNMSLFAFNLLPIPGLDGGQIYPILFEMFTGIKMSKTVEKYWQISGIFLLLLLFVFATWNDLSRLFSRK